MLKYTNGDIFVNAMRFTPDSQAEIWSWLCSFEKIPATVCIWNNNDPYLEVHQESRNINAYFGDWVVEDSDGNFHVLENSVFSASYTEVSNEN